MWLVAGLQLQNPDSPFGEVRVYTLMCTPRCICGLHFCFVARIVILDFPFVFWNLFLSFFARFANSSRVLQFSHGAVFPLLLDSK